MENRGDHILQINPTHPLAPVADSAAESELERCKHGRERSAFCAQHHSGAQTHGANSGIERGLRGRLPLPANLGQKSCARSAVFPQDFISAVAVVADRGGTDKDLGLVRGLRQRPGQIYSAGNAAVANLRFLGVGPSAHNGFAGKVYHAVKSGDRFRRERLRGIPGEAFFFTALCVFSAACGPPNRTTSAPLAFNAGSSALPIKPDAPLTSTRAIRRLITLRTL